MFIGFALQESYLQNLMDRRAWQATIHRDAKSQTHLSMHICMHAVDSTLNMKIHKRKSGRYRGHL